MRTCLSYDWFCVFGIRESLGFPLPILPTTQHFYCYRWPAFTKGSKRFETASPNQALSNL